MNLYNESLWASITIMRTIVFGAVARGANLHSLCQVGGITPELLEEGEARLSLQQNIQIMEAALDQTGDPLLGLHLVEYTSPATMGLLGHLFESSPDVGSALTNLAQFLRAVSTIYEYRTQFSETDFTFFAEPIPAWHNLSPRTAQMSVELTIGSFIRTMKQLTGKDIIPTQVCLRYPRPSDVREYVRFMKTEPLFNQAENFISIRLKDAYLPLIGHNKALHSYFREAVEKQIEQTFVTDNFSNTIRRIMLQHYDQVLPQMDLITAQLHLTPRTVQRRLQEEGTSFQKIADSVKSELALGLLKNKTLTINEIAYRLGYSDASVFRRAFKKWTGDSPGAYLENRETLRS